MTITLTRVDDRVIHGQTTTRWTKVRRVQGILVVSDKVAEDELRKKVLKAAVGDLKLGIYNIEQGIKSIAKGMTSNKDFFLISDSPRTFAKLLELGVDFGKTLNIGPLNSREGAKVIGRSVAIDQKDYDAFEYLDKNGINIEFQLLPDDEKKTWDSLKANYQTN